MQLRQCLSTIVVALYAVHGAAERVERRQHQLASDPAGSNKAFTRMTTVTSGPDDLTRQLDISDAPEHPARSEYDHEEHRISSSESVPNEPVDQMNPTPIKAGLYARAEEDEPIPTHNPSTLPIEPKITPALGIAGAIMLGTGVALCLVGIKKPWLHIFLSTAYLASLAVTVLIIYVMNPDHSNAIQGAYMVAAVVTGLIFGAVSLIFQEVTEGLGCMLGSFCFAMWLLVLAPGGIIHSVAGRGVLIGVLTVVGFGLSFSHYTRMYGLIVCTSFAGSTIIILGVDCFSRAGLKEFWLYLWSLNDKQFPLETNTYPITRGIRVEIACIIVVFLFGLVSQFKLWQVVKQKRDKNEQERKRVEDERAEAEAAVGRDIEANNEKERAQWEAVYGGKGGSRTVDSGVGSSIETFGKDQVSVKERELDPVELSDIAEVQSQRRSGGDERTSLEGQRKSGEMEERHSMESGERSSRNSQDSAQRSDGDNTHIGEENGETDNSTQAYAPGAPEVVPLPFSVPTEEQDQPQGAEPKSEAPRASLEESKAESVGMPLKKASLRQLDEQFAAGMAQCRDDQQSSIAATADDIAVIEELPGQHSNRNSAINLAAGPETTALAPPHNERSHSRGPSVASQEFIEDAVDEDDEEALPREPVVIHQETAAPVAPAAPVTTEPTEKSLAASKSLHSLSDAAKTQRPEGSSEGLPGSVSESMVHQLPPKLSKIALTYRTNEWAKHIADADAPEYATEELARPSSPGVQIDTSFPEEKPKPVDVEALQQTNAPIEPVVVPTHKTSKSSKKSKSSHRKNKSSEQSNNLNRTPSTQSVTPIYGVTRSSSQLSLNRNDSTSSSPARPMLGSKRQTSITHQTLVESPVEDAPETFQYNNFNPTPSVYGDQNASASTNNLLDERTKMLQRRQTTTSFNGFRSTPSLGLMSGAIPEDQAHHPQESTPGITSPTMSSPTLPHYENDDENMTLSQRRSLMQNSSQTPNPTQQTPTHKPRASVYSTMAYDSHQPARQPSTNTAQQSARLNQWRQTLQADAQSKQPPLVVESHARQNMIDDRRQNEARLARQKEEQGRRQSAIDEAMRRGHLDGAHRDALRRMQARANKDGA